MMSSAPYAMTEAELADAFDRLTAIRQHLRLPWEECARVAEQLRAGSHGVGPGPRTHSLRTLRRLTQQATIRTRSTYKWLGYAGDDAYAAGETVRAHVFGTQAPRAMLTRGRIVGGWVADLAMQMLAEATA